MKLYHGTTESVARKALIEGLKPRSMLEENGNGNWEHTVESNPECVYLTDTYAGYFAMNATKGDEKWGIVEIDVDLLDEGNLLPDEDWLEQGTRGDEDWDYVGKDMLTRTRWFRDHADLFQHLWQDSVKSMGNCCHRGIIPPEAITRVGIFDPKSKASITMMAMDPSITPLNHMLCGRKYRALTAWLVGDEIDVMEFYAFGDGSIEVEIKGEVHPMMQDNINHLKGELADRTGQEILTNEPMKWVSWQYQGDRERGTDRWTLAHATKGGPDTLCGWELPTTTLKVIDEPEKKCKRCERKVK